MIQSYLSDSRRYLIIYIRIYSLYSNCTVVQVVHTGNYCKLTRDGDRAAGQPAGSRVTSIDLFTEFYVDDVYQDTGTWGTTAMTAVCI